MRVVHRHDRLLTTSKAARLLNVSAPTVRRWAQAGRIRAVTFADSALRCPKSEVCRVIEEMRPAIGRRR